MLRLLLLCCVLTETFLVAADDTTHDLKDSFKNDQLLNNESLLCNTRIEGSVDCCHDCYECNSYKIQRQRSLAKQIKELKLFNDQCKPKKLCCFSQQDYIARSSSSCGTSYPGGIPRSVRNNVRAVLQGEYPWRTFIYSRLDLSNPLCGGAYVDVSTRTVMTSASCVEYYDKDDLLVKFSKTDDRFIRVDKIIMHDAFDTSAKTNDIALLRLSEMDYLPDWASVVCLLNAPPQFPTACIAITKEDKYINTMLPQQSKCVAEGDDPLDESHLCGVAPKYEYQPELGSGLFCETDVVKNKAIYTLYGINLFNKINLNMSMSIYTNIFQYSDWLQSNFK